MDHPETSLAMRAARPDDAAAIYALICELADYEKLRHEVDATEADIAEALFGANPRVFAEIAEWSNPRALAGCDESHPARGVRARQEPSGGPPGMEGVQMEIAGFSLWFYNYSTFRGRHGLYLEDLYVRPVFRGHGIGKALIVSLAKRCVAEGLARFQWSVLDWNKPSIDFYESLGAKLTPEWLGCRVEGEALAKLANTG
jgi:diamine N-acetyltransferase